MLSKSRYCNSYICSLVCVIFSGNTHYYYYFKFPIFGSLEAEIRAAGVNKKKKIIFKIIL